jgi:predicted flap endonuclease-1-like 5' DNA nuclease
LVIPSVRIPVRLPGYSHNDSTQQYLTTMKKTTARQTDVSVDDVSADDLPHGIGNPARRAFAAKGIVRLKQITKYSETELLSLHGVGPKAIRIIREALSQQGLSFADASE